MAIDIFSPWPALIALALAWLTAWMLSRFVRVPAAAGRTATLDGLRGYLAFGVFLHHGALWYGYERTGQWDLMASHLYTHFGQSSVALFFMITGYLFFSKLLDARSRPLDWIHLFVSRVMRLAPLYAAAMLLLFGTVAVLSHFELREPPVRVAVEMARWSTFNILDPPDINGVGHTPLILAGVTWSLAYEWFFYLALPLLALAVRIVPRWPWLAVSAIAVAEALHWGVSGIYIAAFGGGIAAALLARRAVFARFASQRACGAIVVALVTLNVAWFPTVLHYPAIALLAAAFACIASGNDLFGVLTHRVSRTLGEVSYSLYLLHGFVLFVTFHFVLADRGRALTPMQHWAVVLAVAPFLIALCFATFRLIEAPGIAAVPTIVRWIRAGWDRLSGWRRASI